MNQEKIDGQRIIAEVMGPVHMERRAKARNAFNDVLQDYSEEVCFGRVWAREGLDRKLRSILNIAMLTALNRPAQLGHHIESALHHGATVEEIREILLHAAVYCGLPAAGDAFKVAETVLKAHQLIE
jgi:4-carboxymuconolactone decarboxylase